MGGVDDVSVVGSEKVMVIVAGPLASMAAAAAAVEEEAKEEVVEVEEEEEEEVVVEEEGVEDLKTAIGMAGLWYFKRGRRSRQNFEGPMWPCMGRVFTDSWILVIVGGRISAPGPRRMLRSL